MHARLNYRQVQLDKMDDVIKVYQDSTLPTVRSRKGFKGAFVLTDRSSGKLIAMALWETEADMRASVPPDDADAITGEPPRREEYEVSIQV